jgi:hypothetical protein
VTLADDTSVVIFSKDRAAQLDLLLATMKIHWKALRPTVLWTASEPVFERGYEKANAIHPGVKFVRERPRTILNRNSAFKKDLLSVLDARKPYVLCFVDDVVFLRSPDEEQIIHALCNDKVACASLRMQPGYDHAYTRGESMVPPTIGDDGLWDWTKCDHDWGYPMTVDGHLYRMLDIEPLFRSLKYRNPNSLEAAMDSNRLDRPLMHCHGSAVIVNNPANLVQTQHGNRHGDQSAHTINERFIASERIDPECVDGVERRGPHTEFAYRFIRDQR